jgi:hypothetical protein
VSILLIMQDDVHGSCSPKCNPRDVAKVMFGVSKKVFIVHICSGIWLGVDFLKR